MRPSRNGLSTAPLNSGSDVPMQARFAEGPQIPEKIQREWVCFLDWDSRYPEVQSGETAGCEACRLVSTTTLKTWR